MSKVIYIIGLVLIPNLVFADSDKKEIMECYDKTASRGEFIKCIKADSKTTGTKIKKSKWETYTTTNELDDSKIYVATIDADSGAGRFKEPITFYVRCQNNKTEMFINWNYFLGMDTAKIAFRVGDDKAVTSNWSVSTNRKASFFNGSPIKILLNIENNSRLVAQVTPYGENPVTAVFDTSGAKEAFKDIRQSCKWPER